MQSFVHILVFEHCSPQGRVLQAGGEPAPGIGVRVTVGVTGATPPPPIEFRADTTGAIVIPINVPSGATALDLSVSGDMGDIWGHGDMGKHGEMGGHWYMGIWGHGGHLDEAIWGYRDKGT